MFILFILVMFWHPSPDTAKRHVDHDPAVRHATLPYPIAISLSLYQNPRLGVTDVV